MYIFNHALKTELVCKYGYRVIAITVIQFSMLLFAGAQSRVETQKPKTGQVQKTQSREKIQNEHDTPPPVIVTTGSLIVDANTKKSDWSNVLGSTGRRTVSFLPLDIHNAEPSKPIYIAHIKVIDGSGDLLFRLDNDKNTNKDKPIIVTAKLTNGEVMNLTVVKGTLEFTMDVPDHKQMFPKAGEPTPSKRQRVKYMDEQNNDVFTVQTIEVSKDSQLLYHVTLSELPSEGFELKVMVWWEEL